MRYVSISLKYIVLPLLVVCSAVIVVLLAYRSYLQHKVRQRTTITSPNGIESLEKVTLGGIEQSISIRGWDTSNPVLLHLHGGPGGAELVLGRYFDTALEKHFIMVRWDQRGTGKSYDPYIPAESMNFEQLVADTRELARHLIDRFDVPKIYLVGHSWGSALGAVSASRYPDLFHAFVGVGQMVESSEMERICYQFTFDKATESQNQAALKELGEIGAPPYDNYGEMLIQRKWLMEFGGLNHSDMGNLWWMGATSPDTRLSDVLGYARGPLFSLDHMWDDFISVNLFEQAPRIEVPTYFFLGRHDFNTPPEIAERYFEQLDAPKGKYIVWFDDAGHMIPFEKPIEYSKALIHTVLKETYEPQP